MGSGSEVMFQHNSNQVSEEDGKQKLRLSEVGCAAFDTACYWFAIIGGEGRRRGRVVLRALDLKSGDPWFKSSTLLLSGFVLCSPEFSLCK